MINVDASAGLDGEALCLAISQAQRLCLHAAIYGNFAAEPFASAFAKALANPKLVSLKIIEQRFDSPFANEFAKVLRHDFSAAQFTAALQQSQAWCLQLAAHPKVSYRQSQALPLTPILLIDDAIVVGHYGHGQLPANRGLWLQLDAASANINVDTLWQWAEQGQCPATASATQQALFRYVAECQHAWQHGIE
ncbi:hypothetical protein [Ferrimonas senticii]|uniref:hypothetical protein n=1 Tax=Ferrimonas senticii TaxID=394566 RepID=UPI00040BFBAD|nr:hypothetical protein [Ferrimonas senticii]